MTTKTYLRVVPEPPEGQALILQFTNNPQLQGKDVDANIACGNCKKLVAKDMTTHSLSESLSAQTTLVILCPCGAYNALPSI